jgi:hypothetical protein
MCACIHTFRIHTLFTQKHICNDTRRCKHCTYAILCVQRLTESEGLHTHIHILLSLSHIHTHTLSLSQMYTDTHLYIYTYLVHPSVVLHYIRMLELESDTRFDAKVFQSTSLHVSLRTEHLEGNFLLVIHPLVNDPLPDLYQIAVLEFTFACLRLFCVFLCFFFEQSQ